jgi:deoxyribose-phosphate aldolase
MNNASFRYLIGIKVGFKPAGGIRAAKDSVLWLAMMMEELGEEWTHPDMFRIGASTLLPDIERQLYHEAFGRYHGKNYIPLG